MTDSMPRRLSRRRAVAHTRGVAVIALLAKWDRMRAWPRRPRWMATLARCVAPRRQVSPTCAVHVAMGEGEERAHGRTPGVMVDGLDGRQRSAWRGIARPQRACERESVDHSFRAIFFVPISPHAFVPGWCVSGAPRAGEGGNGARAAGPQGGQGRKVRKVGRTAFVPESLAPRWAEKARKRAVSVARRVMVEDVSCCIGRGNVAQM